jgi:hypothetical protein
VATGRETQSSAFLSWPGIEPLYSGVEKRTPSGALDRPPQRHDGRGPLAGVVVLAVRRDRLQDAGIEQLVLRAGRQQLGRRPQELRVVRIPPQAARDEEDPRRH